MRRLLIGAAAAALSFTSAYAADIVEGPRVAWNYAGWGKPRASSTIYQNLGKYLSERTDGNFTFTVHWGTLSKPRAVLDGLSLGAFQSGTFCASYYPAKLPAHTGLDLPFMPINTFEQLQGVTEDYYSQPILKKETAKWNSMYFASSLLPLYEVVGKGEPPKSLNDWKGLRIRALGQQGKAMEKLGAVPTSVPAPDVYTSMDRGLLDAVGFAYYSHESYRTYELADWFTSGLDISSIACGMLFNTEAYNQLPPQYKELINAYKGSDLGYTAQIAAYERTEIEVPKLFEERGLVRIEIGKEERDAFKKLGGQPVWDAWVDQMTTDHGYDGKALLASLLAAAEKHAK
jgi:TRAP-type mannitol/chloroaromatic compound transport system substrate-binding protein